MAHRTLALAWRLAIIVGLLGGSACSSTSPDSFIPDFTFVWQVKNDTTHTFNLLTASGTASGSFQSGSSEFFKGVLSNLQGTYNHRDMTFTTDRLVNGAKASFTGHFDDDNTITMQSPEGTLTVIRKTQ